MSKTYPVAIVGESNYQRAIAKLREGEEVDLVHEPGNSFDDRAVAAVDARGKTIGYLPRDHWLKQVLIDDGVPVAATVREITGGGRGQQLGVVLTVDIDAEAPPFSAPLQSVPGAPTPAAAPPRRSGCWTLIKWILIGTLALTFLSVLLGKGAEVAPADQPPSGAPTAFDELK